MTDDRVILSTETVIQKRIPNHCECCGMRARMYNDKPYKVGPYQWVCERCHDWPYTWYPDKIDEINMSCFLDPGHISNIELSKLDSSKLFNILLVEPDYYTRFPPLGLLKLATYHKQRGDNVELLRIKEEKKKIKKGSKFHPNNIPDIIYITSLFTWAWESVWDTVEYYRIRYSNAQVYVGGIYASVLPDHATFSGAHRIHEGLLNEIEDLMPAYELLDGWDGSIIFATRGCIRRCSFCVVPKVEGRINSPKSSIKQLLSPFHTKAILWDNNILASPNRDMVFEELRNAGYSVDFNQGIDARLVTRDIAEKLSELVIPLLHLAYDTRSAKSDVEKAIQLLKDAGFRGKQLIFYTLYNHKEGPEIFLQRLKDLMEWGVVSYPMRFEPLTSLKKNQFVSPDWNKEILEMIAKARRVMGFMGSFPPYKALKHKILKSKNLYEAMELRPV